MSERDDWFVDLAAALDVVPEPGLTARIRSAAAGEGRAGRIAGARAAVALAALAVTLVFGGIAVWREVAAVDLPLSHADRAGRHPVPSLAAPPSSGVLANQSARETLRTKLSSQRDDTLRRPAREKEPLPVTDQPETVRRLWAQAHAAFAVSVGESLATANGSAGPVAVTELTVPPIEIVPVAVANAEPAGSVPVIRRLTETESRRSVR